MGSTASVINVVLCGEIASGNERTHRKDPDEPEYLLAHTTIYNLEEGRHAFESQLVSKSPEQHVEAWSKMAYWVYEADKATDLTRLRKQGEAI